MNIWNRVESFFEFMVTLGKEILPDILDIIVIFGIIFLLILALLILFLFAEHMMSLVCAKKEGRNKNCLIKNN